MTWSDIQAAWHAFVDEILDHWPDLHSDRLVGIAGDRMEFARYLSKSYDLTLAEASDVIDTWIRRISNASGAQEKAA